MKKITKILIILIVITILSPAKFTLAWDAVQQNKIAKTVISNPIGNDILVVFAGYKVSLEGAQKWAEALVDKTMKSKGVKTVYAVAGPTTDTYTEGGIELNKIVKSMVGERIGNDDVPGSYIKDSGSRVFIINHSSGVYPAIEFLQAIWPANLVGSVVSIPGKLFYVFNVDGNKTTYFAAPPTKNNFDVIAHGPGIGADSTVYKSVYYEQKHDYKIDVPIDTVNCNITAGVSIIPNCLHMRLVNLTSTKGFQEVDFDYKSLTGANVQVDYLKNVPVKKVIVPSLGTCKITDAKIFPNFKQKDDWYVENVSKFIVSVEAKDCAGKKMGFSITETDRPDITNSNKVNLQGLESEQFLAPADRFDITIIAGEEFCEAGPGYDCHVYFEMTNQVDNNDGKQEEYTSFEKASGDIYYECRGDCNTTNHTPFIYKGVEENTRPVGQDPEVVNAVDATKAYNGTYTLLAPIGKLTQVKASEPISVYLNIIFKLAIGLCIALAVIMLVIHGIKYMGDESVFGKTEAMSSIRATIGGLILAIGAYAILNTINPDLVRTDLSVKQITVNISPDLSSTGSSTKLCLSATNPPNPDDARGSVLPINDTIKNKYIPARDALNLATGVKLLITAQTAMEGFFESPQISLSYQTNNPGNIGNTDDGKIKSYKTLADGIKAQNEIVALVVGGQTSSYKIGGKYDCALGGEKYDGSLYQYLRIYSTGARNNNNYVNAIIGYFSANGKTITARTKMSEIANMK